MVITVRASLGIQGQGKKSVTDSLEVECGFLLQGPFLINLILLFPMPLLYLSFVVVACLQKSALFDKSALLRHQAKFDCCQKLR